MKIEIGKKYVPRNNSNVDYSLIINDKGGFPRYPYQVLQVHTDGEVFVEMYNQKGEHESQSWDEELISEYVPGTPVSNTSGMTSQLPAGHVPYDQLQVGKCYKISTYSRSSSIEGRVTQALGICNSIAHSYKFQDLTGVLEVTQAIYPSYTCIEIPDPMVGQSGQILSGLNAWIPASNVQSGASIGQSVTQSAMQHARNSIGMSSIQKVERDMMANMYCTHDWVDTGMRTSWCKHCNMDKPNE